MALMCFAVAQVLSGSGFIAAFSGGIFFGILAKHHKEELLRAAEGAGDTLSLATWVSFGAAVVGQLSGEFSWPILMYALLSLRSCHRRVCRHRLEPSPPGRARAGADGCLHGDFEHPCARIQREPAGGVIGCKAGFQSRIIECARVGFNRPG